MLQGESSKYSQKQLNCDICYHHYDQSDHKPILLCTQRHTICHYCVKKIIKDMKCPFCREVLNPNGLAINQNIYNQIGSQIVEANVRVEISQSLYASSLISEIIDVEFVRINDEYSIEDQMLMEQLPEMHTRKTRKFLYLFILFVEIPVFCSDLYLSITQPSQCMQTSLFGIGPTIQTWSIAISLIEFLHFLLFLFAYAIRVSQQFYVNEEEKRFGRLSIYKIAICTLVDSLFFFNIIISQCEGFVHLYGIILLSMHGLAVLAGCIYLIKGY